MTPVPLSLRIRLWIERRRRERLKRAHRTLFDGVSAILFKHDPMGINFEDNTDEYDQEAGTILPRLRRCGSEQDVIQVVYEEFDRWFGPDLVHRGGPYDAAARDIWALYRAHAPG